MREGLRRYQLGGLFFGGVLLMAQIFMGVKIVDVIVLLIFGYWLFLQRLFRFNFRSVLCGAWLFLIIAWISWLAGNELVVEKSVSWMMLFGLTSLVKRLIWQDENNG